MRVVSGTQTKDFLFAVGTGKRCHAHLALPQSYLATREINPGRGNHFLKVTKDFLKMCILLISHALGCSDLEGLKSKWKDCWWETFCSVLVLRGSINHHNGVPILQTVPWDENRYCIHDLGSNLSDSTLPKHAYHN